MSMTNKKSIKIILSIFSHYSSLHLIIQRIEEFKTIRRGSMKEIA